MKKIPYFSQWESRTLIDKFLSNEMRSEEDPLWPDSGASSAEEYAQWSPHICGMACLKMLLAYRLNVVVPLLKLVHEAIEYGVYQPQHGDKGKRLLYRPFAKLLKERYSVDAHIVERTDSATLEPMLKQGHVLMASVHPGIRHDGFKPPTRGGHLVLVFDVDKETGDWLFHNPSGFSTRTQENVRLARQMFDRYFANRGILIAP